MQSSLQTLFAFTAASLAASLVANGQTTPPPAAPPAPNDVVELSPFQVSAESETGYQATNTLEGSRLNTPLRDTPGAISVFTKDLLDDLGVTDIEQMIRYDVNSEESHQDAEFSGVGNQAGNIGEGAGSTGNASSWRTRGLVGSVSLDGFRAVGRTDTYNVESAGSTRGPNAILFGTGAAGGVLNLRTKMANPYRHSNQIELKVGDNSFRRATVDFNRALIKDRLALRVMGVAEEKGSPQPHKYTEKIGHTLAAQYRFGKHTNLNLSYEDTRTKGVSGRNWPQLDSITLFLQEFEAGRVVWDPTQERYETLNGAVVGASSGVANLSPRSVLVYGPDLGPPTLWEGARANANRVTLSTATSIFTGPKPVVPESLVPSGLVTSTGGAEYGEVEFTNFTATFNHRWFENFFMELAYNQSDRSSDAIIAQNPDLRADLNYRLPDGSLNPYFFGNGYYFSQGSYLRNIRANDNETFRASFSYDLDLGRRWGKHRFALMGERHVNNELFNRVREVWAGAPYGGLPEAAANQVSHRRYFQIGGPLANYTPGWNAQDVFASVTHPSAVVPGGSVTTTWVPPNFRGFDDEVATDSQLFVMQNYLLDRRLVTTLGLRYDQVETFGPGSVRDPVTQIWRRAGPGDQGPFSGVGTSNTWFESSDLSATRRSLGAVYHLNPMFSLTANFSNGIQIPERNRTVLPSERVADPYEGDGRDYGINFSFLENRISGAVKYYESKSLREGGQELVQDVYANPNNDVLASFDYYFRDAGLTTFGASDPLRSVEELRTTYWSGADAYLFDQESSGWEFETIANPTRNWTVRLNYSYTDRSRTNVLLEGEGWWAERVALFRRLDTLYTQRTGRASLLNQPLFNRNDAFVTDMTVGGRIADSDTQLAQTRLEEEHGFGNRKHKANVWTRYLFTTGPLKGFALAGGWRFQGKNLAGIDLATGRLLYGNPRSLFDAMLQYKTKGLFGFFADRTSTTYQLNVVNLFNDRSFFVTKKQVDTLTGTEYMMRGFREEPRNGALTVRVNF